MFRRFQAVLALAVTVQAGTLYFPPPGEGLDVQSLRTPAQTGFREAVVKQLEDVAPRWALWRAGHLVHVKGDFNQTQNVASNRKTWHALTVGAAIQQGKIPSLDQKLGVWNKELTGKNAQATWRHVITQSAGFDYPYSDYPAYLPGKMWTYSDLNPIQLCNALARAYGKKDYHDHYDEIVRQAYFDAIGMRGWRVGFRKDLKSGLEDDGIRYFLDLEDMGRLGLLVVARGEWNGRRLIPEWFVKQLETKQTRGMRVNYNGPNDGAPAGMDARKFPEVPYGFMTWVNTDGDYFPGADRGWAMAIGAGGFLTLWNHKYGIVFAAAGAITTPTTRGVPHILEANLKK